ncbi:peptidase C14 [Ceraceosorus guamensis]|uniref:Peptidase C14 n=1 Tax=Ceraceosorus guamensis TaxID=1522189 RepID=A0A316VZ46_9BASI|nr:peptidase C14 [Ceraceosorus guamensis]PWN42937.1 peptidase C14 [Ceraceosorus guamensis]
MRPQAICGAFPETYASDFELITIIHPLNLMFPVLGQQFQYSSMRGKRKALLIGINYRGTRAELRGCWNDVENMKRFISQRGYHSDDMVVLTDASSDPRSIPTRQNMTAAMHWLVRGAAPGDALFFHFSGHGGQAKATQGDEADGMNETILPLDYERAGQMEDDELHAIMVRPLPVGCRLTALFDSCHSGTALDLPYVYSTSGNIKEPNVAMDVGKGILNAGMSYARGDLGGMVKGLFSTFKGASGSSEAEEITKQTRSSGADVIMLSGCKDAQTSADASEAGKATGAMSWAFIKVCTEYSQLSYLQMLNATRDALVQKYSQKPQLSASHPMDLNLLFTI